MLQPDFRETFLYEATAKPEEVLRDLAKLRYDSEHAAGRRRFWAIVAFIWFVAFAIALVVAADQFNTTITVVVGFIGGIGLSIFLILAYERGKCQLSPRRYLSAATAIRCLACDVAHDATITVRVDFNECVRPTTLVNEIQDGPIRSGVYRATWLRLTGQFVDKTKFDFQADLRCKQKRRTRRKGDRIKREQWENLCLTLKVRDFTTGAERNWADRVREMRPPFGLKLRSADGVAGQLVLEFETEHANHQFISSFSGGKDNETKMSDHRGLLFPFLAAYDALHRIHKG